MNTPASLSNSNPLALLQREIDSVKDRGCDTLSKHVAQCVRNEVSALNRKAEETAGFLAGRRLSDIMGAYEYLRVYRLAEECSLNPSSLGPNVCRELSVDNRLELAFFTKGTPTEFDSEPTTDYVFILRA